LSNFRNLKTENKMGYLQLSEGGQIARRSPVTPKQNAADFYIYVPSADGGAGKWVREDFFDDLSDQQYIAMMQALEPFQPQMLNENYLSGLFSGKGAERRQARRAERKESKAAKQETKQAAKTERAAKRSETIGKLLDTAKGIFGGTEVQGSATFESGSRPDFDFKAETDTRPFYKKPAFIIGGVVVIGGLIYFLSKRKKK
jgi:hypothetical protein